MTAANGRSLSCPLSIVDRTHSAAVATAVVQLPRSSSARARWNSTKGSDCSSPPRSRRRGWSGSAAAPRAGGPPTQQHPVQPVGTTHDLQATRARLHDLDGSGTASMEMPFPPSEHRKSTSVCETAICSSSPPSSANAKARRERLGEADVGLVRRPRQSLHELDLRRRASSTSSSAEWKHRARGPKPSSAPPPMRAMRAPALGSALRAHRRGCRRAAPSPARPDPARTRNAPRSAAVRALLLVDPQA